MKQPRKSNGKFAVKDRFHFISEAARRSGVNRSTLHRWIKAKKLKRNIAGQINLRDIERILRTNSGWGRPPGPRLVVADEIMPPLSPNGEKAMDYDPDSYGDGLSIYDLMTVYRRIERLMEMLDTAKTIYRNTGKGMELLPNIEIDLQNLLVWVREMKQIVPVLPSDKPIYYGKSNSLNISYASVGRMNGGGFVRR